MPNDFIDFAWRRRRTLSRIVRNRYWASAALVIVVAFALDGLRHHKLSVAKDREWTLSGAACPGSVAEVAPTQSGSKYREIEFGGNHFRRRFGHVACSYVETAFRPVPVCQFTAPGEMRVVTPRGIFNFAPGVGKKATVAVRSGVAQCVLSGNFEG